MRGVGSERYPESVSPMRAELEERYPRFAELREDCLLEYGYNTARAYWGDLEHLNDWCIERSIDVLALSETNLTEYLAWMAALGYSMNTMRRRRSAIRVFQTSCGATGVRQCDGKTG